ncbi:MAG: hypothetical protein KGZ90_16425 [Algoriphagus sp.]|nr:hypothetical protein [Algoriphagus sp.]
MRNRGTQLFSLLFVIAMIQSCIRIDEDPYNRCPSPKAANAVGIKQVFFSPYKNQRYATASDTVSISDFRYNFELDLSLIGNSNSSDSSLAYPLVCEETFRIENISNLAVILTAPFAGLPVGTDISYALLTPEGKNIAQLKTFDQVSVYFGAKLTLKPTTITQLKSRIFVFFKDGSRSYLDATSPYLKTN